MGRIATIGSLYFHGCITIYRREDGRTFRKVSVTKHVEVQSVDGYDWVPMSAEEEFDCTESVEVLQE
ncbi:MAG: hypothetical protein A2854_01360 [Parcubacteria group bacterium RIFCSPHIGHO2_01_FULL_56_18]|nr:MAG: hypothetical protein A2854_01360 [Parcubacteria group bacterium RIFCSPHIGHO2_01_FULL_56_18]